MTSNLPPEVADALDCAGLPGSWEFRDGLIYVGINEPFNGYPLELSAVTVRLDALTRLADYLKGRPNDDQD